MNALKSYIKRNPNITLTRGLHRDLECGSCILELCSVAMGVEWTDNPQILKLPDLRGLNDAAWSSNKLRTEHLLRVGVAVYPWAFASDEKRWLFAKKLVKLTIQRVMPPILRAAGMDSGAAVCKEYPESLVMSVIRDIWTDSPSCHVYNAASQIEYAAGQVKHSELGGNSTSPLSVTSSISGVSTSAASVMLEKDPEALADDILITACDCWVEAASELV